MVSLRRQDVTVEEDAVAVWVAKQKNNPNGRVRWCWVPRHIDEPGPSIVSGGISIRLGFHVSLSQPLFAVVRLHHRIGA